MRDEGIQPVVWGSPGTALLTHTDAPEGQEGVTPMRGEPHTFSLLCCTGTRGHSPVPRYPRSTHSAGLERCRRGQHPGGAGTWLQPRVSW